MTRVAARRTHMMLVHSARSGNGVSTLSTWIAGAVNRGQKVLYELAPDEDPDAVLNSRRRGLGPDVVTSGQLEVLDAAGLRTECGGRADGVHDVHRVRLKRARDDGWAGLAVATGGDVFTAAVDEPVGRAHERGVDALVVGHGMTALCRFRSDCTSPPLGAMLVAHHSDVEDEIWGAVLIEDRLCVRGEIDASNAERVGPVLHGAVAAGVRAFDLSELEFCAAAGLRAFTSAAAWVAARGERLELHSATPGLVRVLGLLGLTDHPGIRIVSEAR